MDASLYMPSAKALQALGGLPAAPPAAFAAASVKETTSPLRSNFLAGRGFAASAPAEGGAIAMYSPAFYAACTVGGILSCGLTHTFVTPLDIVKCNMQARRPRLLQRSPASAAP
jgi:hypothetical protein